MLTAVVESISRKDRRSNPRARISKPVRVRTSNIQYKEEVRATLNASRDGLYFMTLATHYFVGMRLRVTFPYEPTDLCSIEFLAEVVRTEQLQDNRLGVAVQFVLR